MAGELTQEEINHLLAAVDAAERGDAEAQYELGLMYANGRGVPEDFMKALEWVRKAAVQGHAEAKDWFVEATKPFERLRNLMKQSTKMQMEKLIGQVVTTQEDKKYLATSMRQVDDKYLYHFVSLNEPIEMIVGDVILKDETFSMRKYTGSDYDKILSEFMKNAMNDLQTIRTKL